MRTLRHAQRFLNVQPTGGSCCRSSELGAKIDRNFIKAPDIETQRQRRGEVLPRIASFFQFLRDSESEAQRRVDEMDKARLSTFHVSWG